ncbi:acyl CoA:acetate/3-ketoacid CoA transferase [Rossellomorea aquimaris]|uniref:acyl CoA:acetate/3-ketoacid CoA transferase n=1 Tax=Rossellomorea aquimaris TaxID=189382 RepID=UPI001CD667CC|nr:CoA-transferase [Rossellomorea aquimaris]MCA1060278.1 acyl CoA:acetate/3-ketoacid CoA transferase [Rossellomorea aquimaris]
MTKKSELHNLVSSINNGSTLALCGFTLKGACESVLKEIENRFLSEGVPNNLTLLHAAGHSDRVNGLEHLAHKGLVTRIIGSHWGLAPKWGELIQTNQVEAHCLPQGQLTHLFRAMAGGKPGNFSKVGMGTFVDPRVEGGKMNDKAKANEGIVEVVNILGEEYLFYKEVPIDVCIIRGTTADEAGNITMEEEALKLEAISVAQATKRFGGKVIVQVKNYVEKGTLPPKDVVIPGIYVDHIIQSGDPLREHRQTASAYYNPVYCGRLREPLQDAPPLPLDVRKVIGRRAVKELYPDAIVNLGTGIPGDTIGPVSSEEGILGQLNLTIESGVIGGQPLGGTDFGIARNAEAIIEHPYQFDYYTGRGVDITFMGIAEADSSGNVNVSKFGSKTVGCGGFIDITQNAKKVVFCSTFTAGGFDIKVEEGKLFISKDGKFKKFKENINQITFSGDFSKGNNQEALFVTERAVFQLTEQGLMLTEIAPGIDLERDILSQMEFEPILSPDLKEMDRDIFLNDRMGFEKEFFDTGYNSGLLIHA